MIPKECKRLAEVDFPIAKVSVRARAEEDSRIAHIPRLHVWPAARPGGACRAVLLASLLPDPCDPLCPDNFLTDARSVLGNFCKIGPEATDLRTALLESIADLSDWEMAQHPAYLEATHRLVEAAHAETPLVVDPFAGGGVIPLEALRLGCDVVSSDVNPVACLINQVVLNDIPRFRDEMVQAMPGIIGNIRERMESDLRELYPVDEDGSMPVALEEDARLTALFLWTLQATADTGEPLHLRDEAKEVVPDSDEEDDDAEHGQESAKKGTGFSLIFDVVRRFAQPLGIHLPEWEGRVVETEKGVVRLISPLARGEQLFGEGGAEAVADRCEKTRTGPVQLELFADAAKASTPKVQGRPRRRGSDVSDESLQVHRGATTLDRVHAAMILQASGRSHALRGLLKSELERGPGFLRLANGLSALYPTGSDEKRLIDAMLLAVPR